MVGHGCPPDDFRWMGLILRLIGIKINVKDGGVPYEPVDEIDDKEERRGKC